MCFFSGSFIQSCLCTDMNSNAGAIVMEEEDRSVPSSMLPDNAVKISDASCSHSAQHVGCEAEDGDAGVCPLKSNEAAGICTGIQSECVLAAATGIRKRAQIRLRDCQVDSGRLTSSIVSADAEQNGNNSRLIKDLMRAVYGQPDQDYDDWQIVMLSDMEDGACLMSQ
jgi:hypothetical protein